jgi:hypothetical protein
MKAEGKSRRISEFIIYFALLKISRKLIVLPNYVTKFE